MGECRNMISNWRSQIGAPRGANHEKAAFVMVTTMVPDGLMNYCLLARRLVLPTDDLAVSSAISSVAALNTWMTLIIVSLFYCPLLESFCEPPALCEAEHLSCRFPSRFRPRKRFSASLSLTFVLRAVRLWDIATPSRLPIPSFFTSEPYMSNTL